MIRAVIFDFAGVLVNESFCEWLAERCPPELRTRFLELADIVDRGDAGEDQFVSELAAAVKLPAAVVREERLASFVPRSGMLQLISTLRQAGYKTAILSNFMHEWLEEIIKRHGLSSYFDEVTISSRERVIKPHPEIYHRSLGRLKLQPAEAVFVDDRQKNVSGAEAVGMYGVLFTEQAQLERDLRQLGLVFEGGITVSPK